MQCVVTEVYVLPARGIMQRVHPHVAPVPIRGVALSRGVADALVRRTGDQPGERAGDIALLSEAARDNIRAARVLESRGAGGGAALRARRNRTARAARAGAAAERAGELGRGAPAELGLQMTYGLAIKTSQGYALPAVGEAYARARELSRQVDDPARVIPALIGLAAHHVVGGEIRASHDVSLEMLALFERLGDPHLQMIGLWSVGAALFHLGELDAAHDHLSRALELYDPAFHTPRVWQTGIEPGIFCRCELSRTLLLRGYPLQGLAQARQAVAQARAIDHPQPLAFALLFEIFAHLALRSPAAVMTSYDELATVCHHARHRAGVAVGGPAAGARAHRAGRHAARHRGNRRGPGGALADARGVAAAVLPGPLRGSAPRAERWADAQRTLDESATVAHATGQHAYDAEHARLQATLLVRQGITTADAERWFTKSLAISRSQGARWLELRAARAYADFLVHAGRVADARDVLEPILAWFSEGHDTLDYAYAEGLLRTIG